MKKRINHMAFDDESMLFGSLAQNNEFRDGFLTYTLRKACRVRCCCFFFYYKSKADFFYLKINQLYSIIVKNESTTWLCLDGPILPSWSDNFNSIFDSGMFLQLKNGDHLNNMCKLVFETGDISNASPSLLSKAVKFLRFKQKKNMNKLFQYKLF
jgi:dynein heavy chain